MILSEKVMLGEFRWCVLVFASLFLGQEASGEAACERGRSWWDRQRAACVPCTACDSAAHQAVRMPCELHRDTVCQSLYDLQIFNEPSDSNSDDYYDYEDSEVESEWDYQTLTLAVAASGCVVFFVVVLFLSFYHAKQWRILKQALKSDVKDLSAKLRLMEAGEPPAQRAPNHHIYCNIHVAKSAFIGPGNGKKGLANVYTQEKSP